MYNRLYKRLFMKNAVKLFASSTAYNFINFFAVLFFSRATKRGRLMAFTDRLLTKKICECKRLHGRCEYFRSKLEQNRKYAPV